MITIIGCGYVGLVSAVCFAKINKSNIFCYDNNKKLLQNIKNGELPFFEPGLNKHFHQAKKKNKIHFSDNLDFCLSKSEYVFICVGTPTYKNKKINLNYIKSSSIEVGKCLKKLKKNITVIVKSTVPPGTTTNIVKKNIEQYSLKKEGLGFDIAMNPEFLREGSAVKDFLYPDRIIIGANSKNVHNKIKKIYSSFIEKKILLTSVNSAELMKYASNTFFSMLITYSNEFLRLSRNLNDVNVDELFDSLFRDRRFTISKNRLGLCDYIKPGPGFGGSCFPKDLLALEEYANSNNTKTELINSIYKSNESQFNFVIDKIKLLSKKKETTLGFCGMSFKANSDDLRQSPSIKIINLINKKLKNIKKINWYDVNIPKNKKFSCNIELNNCSTLEKLFDSSNIIVLMFLNSKNEKKIINNIMKRSNKVLLDTRSIFHKETSNINKL